MKFMTITTLEQWEEIHVNIDHIVLIELHWARDISADEEEERPRAKILLSNNTAIICEEEFDEIQDEYKELFKQY